MSFLAHGVQLHFLFSCNYMSQWILYYFWISSHLKQPQCEILAFSKISIRIQSKVIFLPRLLPLLSCLSIRGSIQSVTELGPCSPGCSFAWSIKPLVVFPNVFTHKGLVWRLKIHLDIIARVIKEVITKMLLEERQHDSALKKQFIYFFSKQIWHVSMINLTFTQHSNEGGPLFIIDKLLQSVEEWLHI